MHRLRDTESTCHLLRSDLKARNQTPAAGHNHALTLRGTYPMIYLRQEFPGNLVQFRGRRVKRSGIRPVFLASATLLDAARAGQLNRTAATASTVFDPQAHTRREFVEVCRRAFARLAPPRWRASFFKPCRWLRYSLTTKIASATADLGSRFIGT